MVAILAMCFMPRPAAAQDVKQKLFERVFGAAVKPDPAMVAKVKAKKPGERVFIDTNGDGKNDECWFIDTSPRHTDKARPILVRAIDEDGDMDADKGPDLDSDLYVADWKADGTADVVIDYQDNGGDNALHEMGMYFYLPKHPFFGKDVLMVWWGRDDGGDHTLWYDVDYTYYQDRCQYRCHFSGDETFVSFGLRPDSDRWIAGYECPFLFWDPDGDRCSEIVLRFEVRDEQVHSVRYSFDADDDACGDRTHDYDFSLTAVAPKDRPLRLAPGDTESTKLRGIPTQGWMKREPAQAFAQTAAWEKVLLTWDEMNANTEENVQRDPHERWEGVIAHGSQDFPQVGGPPCSTLNKRNELCLKPTAPMRLYYSPADRRLHLLGAAKGWLDVDYDLDGKADAKYAWFDDDGDGVFDRRTLDLDADGKVDFEWKDALTSVRPIELDWKRLSDSYCKPELQKALADSQAFVDAAKAALGGEPDAVETFFLAKLDSWMPQTGLGAHMRRSPAGARFYMDMLRDRLFGKLHAAHGKEAAWAAMESLYAAGDYARAADVVAREWGKAARPNSTAFGGFTRRIAVTVDNRSRLQCHARPLAFRVDELKKTAPDFNPDNCAVVAPQRWIGRWQIPHQVDTIDPAVGPELSFMADFSFDASETWHIYYSPTGKSAVTFANRTGTAEDWVPPNIGWESSRTAYRAYWGQFDFFGKKTGQLVYDNIEKKSYHGEVEWGIDALHVGNASGLGGLTLYVGDKAFLVQNPAGKGNVAFTKRQVCKGPVRAVVEIAAGNIVPDEPSLNVRIRCIAWADRKESEIRVKVTGARDGMTLAPGLVKLTRDKTFADKDKGCIGSWGWQEAVIGEIGMAVITDPARVVDVLDLTEERRMQCRLDGNGELRYWIVGDWQRGRQHPVAPTIDNWRREVQELARSLAASPKVTAADAEDVK